MTKKFAIRDIPLLAKETFKGFPEDKIPKLSGALAYYMVFSMGPLLVVVISLCGIFLGREAVEGQVFVVLQNFLGKDTAATLQDIIRNAAITGESRLAAIIGIVTLLIGATTVFAEIQESINGIWGIKPKPQRGFVQLLRNRVLSFSIIVSLGFLLLVSLAVTGLIEVLSRHLQAKFPDLAVTLFYILNLLLTLGASALIFGVIFKVLPDARIRWRDVRTGALVTATLFLLGKFAISFYISKTRVGSTYGAAGSLVVLLVWIYYSSIILYLGARFTKVFAVHYSEPIIPNDYAVTTQQVEVETGKKSVQHKEKIVKKVP
ncbi:YihY/virulence factor BrkB family protein [Flavihumibacter petaseus]|nr:YihY/virulence factor BrkB family protein [Flavihumibacter petaseus]